jgi:hypothetical protein
MADWVASGLDAPFRAVDRQAQQPLTQGGALRDFHQNEVPEHQDSGEQAGDQPPVVAIEQEERHHGHHNVDQDAVDQPGEESRAEPAGSAMR